MTQLLIKNVRHAFSALDKPQAIGDGEPAWGDRLIIDPKDPQVKAIDDAIREVARAKWKDDADDVLEVLREEKKVAFVKGPYRSKKTGKVYEGFEGMYNLGTRNAKERPTALDKYGKEITDVSAISRVLYTGCYVHAKVEFWAQDNEWGRRINCTLLGTMFANDGPSFGGGAAVASADDFAGLAKAEPEGSDFV